MIEKVRVFIYNQEEYRTNKDAYANHPILEIEYGNIFNHKSDCLITAGNSYGMMDGGIDGTVNCFFDMIEERVQDKIMRKWYGELPVGCSLVFDTSSNNKFKYLCYSPTMRIPGNVVKSINAYHAMRGALIECSKYKDIKSISVPLLCRGVGCMQPEEVLHQIKHAFETFTNPTKREWHAINDDYFTLMQGYTPE